jgi:hypothetical protein
MKWEGIQEASVVFLTFIHFSFLWIGVWTQGFVFARQVLNHLSQDPSPFYSGYFGDRVLLFAQAILDHDPRILSFLLLLEWQTDVTMPSFFPWDRGLTNLFKLGSNPNPSDFCTAGWQAWQAHGRVPNYWLRWGVVSGTICPGWPSDLSFWVASHWHPAVTFYTVKGTVGGRRGRGERGWPAWCDWELA